MRYLIQFKKEGLLRYTSHLDMMRLFQRTFHRAGIALSHSQGYNPHPKMCFAQPLSLGYSGTGEYLEIETEEDLDKERLIITLNVLLPQGISVLNCRSLPQGVKSSAASVIFGRYKIYWKTWKRDLAETQDLLDCFLTQKRILVKKAQKKCKELREVDIRPMICQLAAQRTEEGGVCFLALVRTGSEANLNPELLMQALCTFLETPFQKEEFFICRTGLYKKDKHGQPVDLFHE